MDFSRLNTRRTVLGGVGSVLLIISILFLPWYSLDPNPQRELGEGFVCGVDEYSCTGFETFPIMRWLLLAAALAPAILAWIIVRGHKLTWPPGEVTMVVGFTAAALIAYNGIIDKPGSQIAEIGVGLDYGYFIALLAALAIAATGFLRSAEESPAQRRTPGTV